jgi:hypothetical protein
MLVDYERVVALLKRHATSKGSHGQRELLEVIARLEAECMIEEGLPEKALRLYGVVLSDDLLRPSLRDPRAGLVDGHVEGAPAGDASPSDRRNHGGERQSRGFDRDPHAVA